MKIQFLFILLFTTNFTLFSQTDEVENDEIDQYIKKAESFGEGNAINGEDYYEGLLASALIIDYHLRLFNELDEKDAKKKETVNNSKLCLKRIKNLRKALKIYENNNWPLRAEFDKLTLRWVEAIENLIKTYIIPLAEPFSRPDDTWTDEELTFYDKYLVDFDKYLEIDEEWVAFQYTFANANNFIVEGTVDIEKWVNPTEEEVVPNDSNEK